MAKRKQRFKNTTDNDVLSFDAYKNKPSSKMQRYPQELQTDNIYLKSNFAPRSVGQEMYLSLLNECEITLCQGPAGCGKTWIATRFALDKLLDKSVSRIVVTKPILEAGQERLGFVPGEIEDKCLPYFQSVLDCFSYHVGPTILKKLLDTKKIEFLPTAYARGKNLEHAYILIDEAQNLTRKGIKLLLTRISQGSLMSINGDTDQIDLPNKGDSGFVWAIECLIGKDPSIGVASLNDGDIQRHPLIRTILANLK